MGLYIGKGCFYYLADNNLLACELLAGRQGKKKKKKSNWSNHHG
jgi:hypothetical protein